MAQVALLAMAVGFPISSQRTSPPAAGHPGLLVLVPLVHGAWAAGRQSAEPGHLTPTPSASLVAAQRQGPARLAVKLSAPQVDSLSWANVRASLALLASPPWVAPFKALPVSLLPRELL